MDAKNILFVAPRFHTNQYYLTKQLIASGYNVAFYAVYKGKSENYNFLEPKVLPVSRLCRLKSDGDSNKNEAQRQLFRKKYFSSFRAMYKEFRLYNPDVVIIRNLKSRYSWQVLFFSLLFGKKTFLYTQNPLHQRSSRKRNMLYKALGFLGIRHFTPVLGNIQEPMLPNSVYIPFVIDPLANETPIRKREGFNLLTIGKMMPRKNIRELVMQLRNSVNFNKEKNILTVIAECSTEANKQYYADLQRAISETDNIRFEINFRINVAHDQVIDIIREADVFILPSNDEPAAFSPLEAMAAGLPVICSNKNGTSCYIEHGKNGYVFKHTPDLAELLPFVDQLLTNDLNVREAGNNSLQLIRERHQASSFIQMLKGNLN